MSVWAVERNSSFLCRQYLCHLLCVFIGSDCVVPMKVEELVELVAAALVMCICIVYWCYV